MNKNHIVPNQSVPPAIAQQTALFVRDLVRNLDIGAFSYEQGKTQRIVFNVRLDIHPPQAHDCIDNTLSYDIITDTIDRIVGAERFDLLETLAERIAAELLGHSIVAQVCVNVQKPDNPTGQFGVDIVRTNVNTTNTTNTTNDATAIQPKIFCIAADAIDFPDLSMRIDKAQSKAPLIIIPFAVLRARPLVCPAPIQNRIDWLTIEQNAWALAAQLGVYPIAQSRTEIATFVRRWRSLICAPYAIVAQTPRAFAGGAPLPTQVHACADWFATLFNASETMVIDAATHG